MAEYSTLTFEVKNNVGHVAFNRPESANGINLELAREFSDAIRRCAESHEVRAVLLTGNGKLFCAGGDVKAFAAKPPGELPDYLREVTHFLHGAISTFSHMSSPIVAAVHGSAAGAGFSLACACDFVFAAETAKFTMAYTRLGLTPDGSATYFLPRIVGYRRALQLAIANPVLTADQAQVLAIVTRVVPDADLLTSARAFAEELATGPTQALGGVKRLLLDSATNNLEAQMAHETDWISEMARAKDGREGIKAFVEKRAPKFRGE
ncbi:MAG: enoyl-CoA hydratase-related protein [Candidatus Binataceae bacterium]